MSDLRTENGCLNWRTALGVAVCATVVLLAALTSVWAQSWVPGHEHPKYANVIAADQVDRYRPAPGYVWAKSDGQIGPVRWSPGQKHPQFAHVIAAEKEGYFSPESGYAWDTPGKLGPVHRIAHQGTVPGASEAESLRRFLSAKGLLNPPYYLRYSEDLRDLYSIRSQQSETAGCPLPNFRDQPGTASPNTVNIFTADFKGMSDSVCRDAPNPKSCQAIKDNCITIENSIFCDFDYLDRLASIAQLTYYMAWKGLGRVQDGETAKFLPLSHDALEELARMTIATRYNQAKPQNLKLLPYVAWLAEQADSSVYSLSYSVSVIAPILHEVAHIEQNYCGRGISEEGQYDFTARLMLTGERDYKTTLKQYEMLTCSHLSRNEIDADLRSMDMLLRYIEKEAPKAIKTAAFNFGSGVDNKMRRELRGLVRWSREIAMLSILHGAEYELLIFHRPNKGLATIRGEPTSPTGSLYTDYYLAAGENSNIPISRGHLDPSFRMVKISKALNMTRFQQMNSGKSVALAHLRVAPLSIGRFLAMRKKCGAGPTDSGWKAVADYVLEAFQGLADVPVDKAKLKEARALLARFMEPGVDRSALTRQLRPSLADYRAVFDQPFADQAYTFYERWWSSPEFQVSLDPKQTELIVYAVSSSDLRNHGAAKNIPAGYRKISGFIKPGLTIYRWKYLEPGKRFGMSYDGLYFVKDHWIWIPKPYRVK